VDHVLQHREAVQGSLAATGIAIAVQRVSPLSRPAIEGFRAAGD